LPKDRLRRKAEKISQQMIWTRQGRFVIFCACLCYQRRTQVAFFLARACLADCPPGLVTRLGKADAAAARPSAFERNTMPKKKTKKCATKRTKTSATGKILYTRAGKSHLNVNKSRKRKRNLRGMALLHPTNVKHLRNMLAS
jgi:large subunit ribosomal protein L35